MLFLPTTIEPGAGEWTAEQAALLRELNGAQEVVDQVLALLPATPERDQAEGRIAEAFFWLLRLVCVYPERLQLVREEG